MDSDRQTDELFDAYVKVQKELWDRWMEIARRFEIATAPETAWWSFQFKVLDEQRRNNQDTDKSNQAWLQLWKDSLDHGNGVLAAMAEWNRRIIEHRDEANKQFLAAWKEAISKLNKDQRDKATQQSLQVLQALQNAVEQAITIPSKPSTRRARQIPTPATQLKHSEHPGKKLPAVQIYPH